MIDPKHMMKFQDKDYVLFVGLLNEAHEQGLKSIETELLKLPTKEDPVAVVRATVTTEKGAFTGHGDAAPNSVNSRIIPAIIRMAETRAVGRAMRWATNIGITMYEELAEEEKAGAKQSMVEKRTEAYNEKRDEIIPLITAAEKEVGDAELVRRIGEIVNLGNPDIFNTDNTVAKHLRPYLEALNAVIKLKEQEPILLCDDLIKFEHHLENEGIYKAPKHRDNARKKAMGYDYFDAKFPIDVLLLYAAYMKYKEVTHVSK